MSSLGHVAIIVLSWNGIEDTLACLSALQSRDYSDSHVTLVDNGSANDVVAQIRERFPSIHILENDTNLGFAEGNNRGIRHALAQNADYLFLLNNDTVVTADVVSKLVWAAQHEPRIGMLCPTIVSFFDPTKSYVGARVFWRAGIGVEIERSPKDLPEVLDTDYAPGCAVFVKSQVVREVGLFDPAYFAYFEDVDWSLRCRSAGYRVVVVPQAVIYHKGTMDHAGGKSIVAPYMFWRNRFLFMQQHGHWYHWLSFLKDYFRQLLLRFETATQKGDILTADAMLDGCWAGLSRRFGDRLIRAPHWFRNLIKHHLGFWLWLTGWLYFWDYQKVKKEKRELSKGSL
jgi:GT2 family glycosyltransferase